ncbi:hypothetical protein GCM10010446_56530 [Streptomyces enissocaesilis]|uniref:Uncharacterized protein n=1 Tax=Streptomyces enissocaesilis TaxID=332589 RepID=A0ABN3XKG9_9ACTN
MPEYGNTPGVARLTRWAGPELPHRGRQLRAGKSGTAVPGRRVVCWSVMGDEAPHRAGAWHRGRDPRRRRTGVPGWALPVLLVSLFVLGPR